MVIQNKIDDPKNTASIMILIDGKVTYYDFSQVIRDDQKKRLRRAYDRLQLSSPERQANVFSLLKKAHDDIARIYSGVRDRPRHPELSMLLSSLGIEPQYTQMLTSDVTTPNIKVAADGSINGFGKYENFDPLWIEAGIKWLEHLEQKVDFNPYPAHIRIENKTSLTIVGDWGAGAWRSDAPPVKVAQVMREHPSEYTIHLGDVYYAGTDDEENKNFLQLWPGSEKSFALNSNHEMYSGGKGYFGTLLNNPRFSLQKHCSFFSFENEHFVIVGLDSAYDSAADDLYMRGKFNLTQLQYLNSLKQKAPNKKFILLSHHESIDLKGVRTPLLEQAVAALGELPRFWYWGHAHALVIYKEIMGMAGRCVGHGAIPYGNIVQLDKKPFVDFYETQSANDPHCEERMLCGFVRLTLDNASLKEDYFDENGNIRFSRKHETT